MKIVHVNLNELAEHIAEDALSLDPKKEPASAPAINLGKIRASFAADKLIAYAWPGQDGAIPQAKRRAMTFTIELASKEEAIERMRADFEGLFLERGLPCSATVFLSSGDFSAEAQRAMPTSHVVEQVIPWSQELSFCKPFAASKGMARSAPATLMEFADWCDLSGHLEALTVDTPPEHRPSDDVIWIGDSGYDAQSNHGFPCVARLGKDGPFVGHPIRRVTAGRAGVIERYWEALQRMAGVIPIK
jgi:hypothetical protein